MTTEYDESCNAYGPIPEPEDQYEPDHTAATKWEFMKAFDAHRRSQERDA